MSVGMEWSFLVSSTMLSVFKVVSIDCVLRLRNYVEECVRDQVVVLPRRYPGGTEEKEKSQAASVPDKF